MQLADYVLQKLKGEQKKTLEEACMRAAQACETIISKGVEKAMNDFNHRPQKWAPSWRRKKPAPVENWKNSKGAVF